MDEHRYTHHVDADPNYRWTHVLFGGLLLTIGIASVTWILYSIVNVTTSPQSIPLMVKFIGFDEEAIIKMTPDGSIQLPAGFFYASGLFLYIIVLGIAGSLTKVLLSTGTRLLEPDIKPLLMRWRTELRGFKE
jgi:hypothetical protein